MRGSSPGLPAAQTVEDQENAPNILFLQGRRANDHGVGPMCPRMDRVEGEAVKVGLLQTTEVPP